MQYVSNIFKYYIAHRKQHLSDVAKSIYGTGSSDLVEQWALERHDELDAGDIDAILNALRLHSPKVM